jgi:hypothetical protein
MLLRVECTEGPQGYPVRLLIDAQAIEVEDIIDRWPGEHYTYFKVIDAGHNTYILRHEEGQDKWNLVMVKRSSAQIKKRGDGWDSAASAIGSPIRR